MNPLRFSALSTGLAGLICLTPAPCFAQDQGEKPAPKGDLLTGSESGFVVVEVHRLPLPNASNSPGVIAPVPLSEETFFATERAVLRSPAVLERVVDRLDLTKGTKSSKADLVRRLMQQVEVARDGKSAVFTIQARSATLKDAQEIALAVAHAYRGVRTDQFMDRAEKNFGTVDNSLREQEDLVEEKRKLFHTIVKAVGIPYLEGRFGVEQIERVDHAVFEKTKAKQQLEIQIKTLLRLKGDEQLRYAAGLNLPDNGTPAIYKQYQDMMKDLARIRAAGLGKNHPNVRMAEISLKELEEDLKNAVTVLQEILQTQLQLVDGQLQHMKEVVDGRRNDAVDKALQSQDYLEAKRDYEEAKSKLQLMKLTHGAKREARKVLVNPLTIHGKY